MRSTTLALVMTAVLSGTAFAQTDADLRAAGQDPSQILTYGMSYTQQRFSPLKQIDRQTVKRLVPAWTYSMANNTGEESQPLIKDGVMYITSHDKTVAVDAMTGREIWARGLPFLAQYTPRK